MSQIVLIDMGSIFHPLWHTTASESEQNPNAMSQQIVAKIRALASGQPHVALALDSRKSFRKELDVTYKASRESKPEQFFHQCRLALETLRADGFPTWEAEGFEADDVISAGVHQATMKAMLDTGWTITIVSSDKDLLQLVNERVKAKNPASGNLLDHESVVEKFGVQPHQILDWLTLVGDVSDGVQGVKGIGAKGAAAILNTFGNLDDCYAAMDAGEAKLKPAAFAALNEFRPRLALTRQLLTLRTDAPIAFEEIFKERVPADVAIFGAEDELMQDINEAMPTIERELSTLESSDAVASAFQEATAKLGGRAIPPLGPSGELKGYDIAQRTLDGIPADQLMNQAPSQRQREKDAQAPAQGNGNPAVGGARSAVSRGMETTAALATVEPPAPVEWERQLEPRTMGQAIQLANLMFQARLFSAYGTPQGVLATILAGRELGMQSMASLRGFDIIDGKPTFKGDLIRALVLNSGKAEYFDIVERTNEKATFVTLRKGRDKPVSLTFTIEDGKLAWAKDEKAWKASGWGRNPADMCVARAGAKLARLVYPDVTHGLYAPSEFDSNRSD